MARVMCEDRAWRCLAAEIVAQGIDDYNHGHNKEPGCVARELADDTMDFLRGGWGYDVCDFVGVDADALADMLESGVKIKTKGQGVRRSD